ncbi:MAG: hypothetical protein AB7E79_14295 [Rhodospirillaceae bacterium]
MKPDVASFGTGLWLSYWPVLIALGGLIVSDEALGAEAPAVISTPVARVQLDRLLACQNADLDRIMAEKRQVLVSIADIETLTALR